MLDHVTLRTSDIEGTRAFFEEVLNIKPGWRPVAFDFPGYWLYAEGKDIIHLVGSGGGGIDREGEAIDHFALKMEGYDVFRAKLETMSVHYTKSDLPELAQRRLFIFTPTGIRIELVFEVPTPAETWT